MPQCWYCSHSACLSFSLFHTHTHTHTHTHARTHKHARTHTHTHARPCLHVRCELVVPPAAPPLLQQVSELGGALLHLLQRADTPAHTLHLVVLLNVCVCVCVCERERERAA